MLNLWQMIRKVSIKHFKQFEDLTVDLPDSLVLAGPNNSGKTTLLQAIALWKFGLEKWLAEKQGKSASAKRTAVQINRSEFTVLPLREMSLMWTDRSSGPGNRDNVEICVEGEVPGTGRRWRCGLEFMYAAPGFVRIRPQGAKELSADELNDFPAPEAVDLAVVYATPMTGVRWDEPRQDIGLQDLRIGQGSSGEILKNLLLELAVDDDNWQEFQRLISDLFNIEVQRPEYQPVQPYIECEYKEPGKKRLLDLQSIGSGTLQVMLLFGLLYARPASVILLDEPDARLHVVLQGEVYNALRKISAERSAQLIVATHSEVLLNSTEPTKVFSIVGGAPKALVSRTQRDQLREALKRLTTTDLLLAREVGNVLYVEGESDGAILSEWSKILGDTHPSRKFFEHPYIVPLWGRDVGEARSHFFALKSGFKNMRGICLLDRNDKAPIEPKQEDEGLWVMSWQRYEIENYLLHLDALERFVSRRLSGRERTGTLLRGSIVSEMQTLGYALPEDAQDLGALPALARVKASEDVLLPLLRAMRIDIGKRELFELAAAMKPDEIHPDVIGVFDKIAEVFKLGRSR